jgi:hypothetical protein
MLPDNTLENEQDIHGRVDDQWALAVRRLLMPVPLQVKELRGAYGRKGEVGGSSKTPTASTGIRSKVLKTPLNAYHITYAENIESIKKQGLRPTSEVGVNSALAGIEYEMDGVFVANVTQAKILYDRFADEGVDAAILEIYLPKGTVVYEDPLMPESSLIVERVPAKNIRVVTRDRLDTQRDMFADPFGNEFVMNELRGKYGRPGKVGGSSSTHSTPKTPADKELKTYLQTITKMRGKSESMQGWKYTSIEDMLVQEGKFFTPPATSALPDGVHKGPNKNCYGNAANLAIENPSYTYVEGFAMTNLVPFPFGHAWVVDNNGAVIDNTWETPGTSYFGIPFTTDYLLKTLDKRQVYGMIPDYPEKKYNPLKDGFAPKAIIEFSISELRGAYGRKGKVGGSSKTPTTNTASRRTFSNSLGIKRKDMPQIASGDMPEFIEWAKGKGVKVSNEYVKANTLLPTQIEYNLEQVEQLTPDALDKPTTVSKDNRVLDGTNRWVWFMMHNPNKSMKVRRIDLSAVDALALMKSFPKAFSKDVSQVGKSFTQQVVGKVFTELRGAYGRPGKVGGSSAMKVGKYDVVSVADWGKGYDVFWLLADGKIIAGSSSKGDLHSTMAVAIMGGTKTQEWAYYDALIDLDAIRINQRSNTVVIETKLLNTKTLKKLQTLHDSGVLRLPLDGAITWGGGSGNPGESLEMFGVSYVDFMSAERVKIDTDQVYLLSRSFPPPTRIELRGAYGRPGKVGGSSKILIRGTIHHPRKRREIKNVLEKIPEHFYTGINSITILPMPRKDIFTKLNGRYLYVDRVIELDVESEGVEATLTHEIAHHVHNLILDTPGNKKAWKAWEKLCKSRFARSKFITPYDSMVENPSETFAEMFRVFYDSGDGQLSNLTKFLKSDGQDDTELKQPFLDLLASVK